VDKMARKAHLAWGPAITRKHRRPP